jgi:uncharacterized membrane protein YbhN (UPF0104 family)
MSRARAVLAYGIAAACLVWLFHDLDWRRLAAGVTGMHWGWAALAIVFDVVSYYCQGWRWELLLRPLGRITPLRATQAIYAGLFTNEVLPLRMGEVVRTYLVARWLAVRFTAVIPSLVVERFFDALWLAATIGVAAIFVELPRNLLRAGDILGAIVLAGTAGFGWLVFRKTRGETGVTPGFFGRLLAALDSGLRDIGRSRPLYLSLAVSFLLLLGQILAYWLIMWAYGLRMSFWVGTVVLLIVHLGTAIPNAPANVGTYQFFTVVGLELFGVDKTVAAGFSLVVFFLLTFPLWVIGSFALSRSGMTLASVRKRVGELSVTAPDPAA